VEGGDADGVQQRLNDDHDDDDDDEEVVEVEVVGA
jgi:hypothetical protein